MISFKAFMQCFRVERFCLEDHDISALGYTFVNRIDPRLLIQQL